MYKPLIKNSLLATLVMTSLVACEGSNQNNSSLNQAQSTGNLAARYKDSGYQVESVDITTLNFGPESAIKQGVIKGTSPDGAVTITLSNIPSASYADSSTPGVQYWSEPEVPFIINVNFNSTVDPSFHLSSLYNDLKTNKVLAGHVIQLDTSNCDNATKQAGTSCSIYGMYAGDAMANNIVNDIHFIFSVNHNNFDFVMPNVANSHWTNDNVPIINDLGNNDILWMNNLIAQNISGTDLIHPMEVDSPAGLVNYGSAEVAATPGNPVIKIRQAVNFAPTPMTSFLANRLMTNCGDQGVAVDGICNYSFNYTPSLSSTTLGTYKERFVFSYNTTDAGINFSKRALISSGDFSPIGDLKLDPLHGQNSFMISKGTVGNDYLAYAPIDSNFSLSLKDEPSFNIGSNIDPSSNTLLYSFGDITEGVQQVPLNQVINNFKITYDPNCFQSGFNSSYDNPLSGRSCNVTIDNSDGGFHYYNKPLTFALYANYTSEIDQQNFSQLLGYITLTSAPLPALPGGSYLNNCRNPQWVYEQYATSKITAWCGPSYSFQLTIDYGRECNPGSTLSYLQGDPMAGIPMQLICDSSKPMPPKPPLPGQLIPKGNYLTYCKNIVYSGDPSATEIDNISAICSNNQWAPDPSDVKILSYSFFCQPGSDVNYDGTNLVCAHWKSNWNPI